MTQVIDTRIGLPVTFIVKGTYTKYKNGDRISGSFSVNKAQSIKRGDDSKCPPVTVIQNCTIDFVSRMEK